MKEILITNDDGYQADGIRQLVPLMAQLGHVTVLAPDGPRSGMSNAVSAIPLMYLKPVATSEALALYGVDNVDVYSTNGTPSDCVKLAINALFGGDDRRISLIVSGINHGSNAAINAIYSGTMGAVFVGAEHGIPSIGFSINTMDAHPDFQFMNAYILPLTKQLTVRGIPAGLCYNINAPVGEIKGVRWTRQCRSHWADELVDVVDEHGEKCYRLGGYLVNDEPEAKETDQWAIEHGYISVQPCTPDTTDIRRWTEDRAIEFDAEMG